MKRLCLNVIVLMLLLSVMPLALPAQPVHSPTRAVLYSAFLPGGGQIYNREYVKAGVVIGVQGFLVGSAIYHDAKKDDYARMLSQETDPILIQQYRAARDEYKNKLNNDFWWIGITSALSMLDAYVDAHLWDFDAQKEKIHLRFADKKIMLRYKF